MTNARAWITILGMIKRKPPVPRGYRRVGRLGSLLFAGFSLDRLAVVAGEEGLAALDLARLLVAGAYFAAALLLLASSRYSALRSFQPALVFLMVPIQSLSDSGPLGALGFAVVGAYLLGRFGYFRSVGPAPRLALLLVLGLSELLPVFLAERPLRLLFLALACAAVSSFVLWIAVTGRPPGGAEPEREVLSLAAHGLSPQERRFALAALEGASMKDIAYKFGVSESTVRNTLASVYHKLGLCRFSDLTRLAGLYHIV